MTSDVKSLAFVSALAPAFLAKKHHHQKHAFKPVSKNAKNDHHARQHYKQKAQQKQPGPKNTPRSKALTTQSDKQTYGKDTQAWPHLRPLLQPLALPVVPGCRQENLWQVDTDAGTGRQFWWHVESRCWSWEPQQDFKKMEFEDINWQVVPDESHPTTTALDDHFEIEWSGSAIEFYSSHSGDDDK
jgi:hypothetical protein